MHVSLDSVLGRQRRLNQVGESITQIAPDPAAAYSLRSLTGSDPKVVRVRRGSDNDERDFTASEVSSGALTSYVNAQVVAPLDIQALEADGRTGDFLIAKAAYSLRSLGTRQATVTSSGDTAGDTSGKYVCQVRRNVNGDLKSFTADEVSDGTLTSFVNESFTSSLPLDVAGSAAAAYGLRNLSSSYTGNVVEVRRASTPQFSASSRRNFTAAEVADGTLVSFVTEPIPKTLSVFPAGSDSTWDVTVVDNSNYTIDCNNPTSTKFCRLINSNLPAGTKYRAEFTLTTNSGDASNLKLNRSSPFNLQNITEGSNSIEFDFTNATFLQFRVGAGSSVFNATISNLTVTAIGNDGHVSTWYDQSGNGNNATQATPANQPKIVENGALLTDGIDFDGTDDFLHQLSGFSLTGSDDLSFFTAYKPDVTNATITLLSQNDGTGTGRAWLSLRDDADIASYLGGGAKDFFSAGSTTDKTLMSVIYDDSANTIDGFKNSVAGTQGTSVSIEAASGVLNIGQSKGNGERFNGHINEVIIYLSDQSDKRRAIEESIATANGITLGSFNRDGFVSTWYDQSVSDQAGSTPNGFHATQATASLQPRVVINGNLNADGIKFDGVDDLLDIGGAGTAELAIQRANPLSIYAVAIPSSAGPLLGDNSNRDLRFHTTGTSYYLSLSPVGATGFSLSSTDLALYSTNHGGVGTQSIVQIHANGVAGTPTGSIHGTSNADTAVNPIEYIGANIGNSYQRYYEKSLKEIIIYKSDQTANRTAIEANIGQHYSIDLPSGVDAGFDQVDGFVETWYDQSGHSSNLTNAWSLGSSNTAFLSNTSSANQITATANSSAGTTGARLIYSFDNFVAPAGSTITATFNVTSITGSVIIKHMISASPSTNAGGDAFEINSTGTFTYSFTTTVDAYGLVAIFGADEAIDAQLTSLTANINVTQATSSLQPKIVNAGALLTDSSGNPAIVGDGTNLNGLFNSKLTEQLNSSDFLVTAAYKDELAMGITGAIPRLYLTSGGMSYNTNQTIQYSNQTGRNILSFQVVGNTQEVFANGSSIGTASQDSIDLGQTLFGVMQGGASISSGPLMEVLVYNSNQSAKRTAIEANINGHYSIF